MEAPPVFAALVAKTGGAFFVPARFVGGGERDFLRPAAADQIRREPFSRPAITTKNKENIHGDLPSTTKYGGNIP